MMNFLGEKLDFERPRIYGLSSEFPKEERLKAKIKHERRLEAMEKGKMVVIEDEDLEMEGEQLLADIRSFRLQQFEG